MIKISVDVMGGDYGPEVTLAGAAIAKKYLPNIHFLFYGVGEVVEPILKKYPHLVAASCFYPTEGYTRMDEKPSQALRTGRGKSSMWHAIEAVKNGEADACVSAGNTGALMAMSYFCLKMMAEAERPGIAGVWPTLRGESIVLDIGATIGASASQLVDLAVMGAGMFRVLYNIEKPSVGLLNVGVEAVKGLDEIKKAGIILHKVQLDGLEYKGFIEGNDIGKGTIDVVVTEGFSGNIALKVAEGTARQIVELLNVTMRSSIFSYFGYLISRSAFRKLKHKMDPDRFNGGVLLGLNGIVIKSHGGATASGFASAIRVGYEMVSNGLLKEIATDLRLFHESKASLLDDEGEAVMNMEVV
ncbi:MULTISPECIES: phosphate acyltransferase PlsX [unclassified Bartonella]|uniref:phosphate acyltransferase PlsX n=1 Tax=unclassified Bartonella TaxID=2645622 RepID=UPI00099B0FA5|nr:MULTISPECIES: phosphate acyltransferase PlsX [unclassified Bartonella]AQX28074.1 phosphate:acyl-[acyl carrier protein] acyltransferase [Bartonella sp. JB15]AQX29347.1 phosphate:acyl-[acyl carrier protein] acyltransferase [Bartonella sp. JB63]